MQYTVDRVFVRFRRSPLERWTYVPWVTTAPGSRRLTRRKFIRASDAETYGRRLMLRLIALRAAAHKGEVPHG